MKDRASSHLLAPIREALAEMDTRHVRRHRRILESPQSVEVSIDGEAVLSFCSNDYLGLANDPRVCTAFKKGVDQNGAGSGASHLITGHHRSHHALEDELADFVGAERALLFSTGYMANLGVGQALLGGSGTAFEDRLNHASLIDAARLGAGKVRRYRHGDLDRLSDMLASVSGNKLILTDAVFSMDGDLADLPRLQQLAERHQSWLLVDDAHGLGVLGGSGRGSLEHFRMLPTTPAILLGTLGKAFGTFGAFVAGEADLIEYLVQRARPYIYTTALPPALAEATRASLRIVREEDWRREALRARIMQFREGATQLGLSLMDSFTPIQPLIFGTSDAALAASSTLRKNGVLVPAIRPPTVPAGSSRLRVSLCALHTAEHVERLLTALAKVEAPA